MNDTEDYFTTQIIYQYPPDLFQLLKDVIPLLCRSKRDVVLFFRGAGVKVDLLRDLTAQVEKEPQAIKKYDISQTILKRLNEKGESSLRERREVLKRVIEFEDFSTCWPNDELKARGLVAGIQKVVNVKDSFTRMRQEREEEKGKHIREYEKKVQEVKYKKQALEELKKEFYLLFKDCNSQERGNLLEKILNRLFEINEILVRESFRRTGDKGKGVIEQIDGVVELDGEVYLVEMKWLESAVGVDDVSRHLVRIYHRNSSRGVFISYTEFSKGALEICKEALQQTVVILCTLNELVNLLEHERDLKYLLKSKIQAAIIDKQPFKEILG
ncbi:MAG: restriction endonuclease [candidate division Zixibacteria bacterium]|nr:restriction endonuclease [candidate division Zixibacteria bacterium]